MKLKSLVCQNCNATLDYENGLDTFFCKYCGNKVILEGQSKAAYRAKVETERMRHEEREQEKTNTFEKFKMEFKLKEDRNTFFIVIGFFGLGLLIALFLTSYSTIKTSAQERKLQAIVDEIILDINEGNFDEAYIKAENLYWDCTYTSEGKKKWDAIRKETIKQIEEAEKEAKKNSGNSFWNWFD